MLVDVKAEKPVRTLRQHVTALVLAWYLAQDILYGVHPEFDDYGGVLQPCPVVYLPLSKTSSTP